MGGRDAHCSGPLQDFIHIEVQPPGGKSKEKIWHTLRTFEGKKFQQWTIFKFTWLRTSQGRRGKERQRRDEQGSLQETGVFGQRWDYSNKRKQADSCRGTGVVLGCQGWLWRAGAETLGFILADMIPGWEMAVLPQGISAAFYQECVLSSTEIWPDWSRRQPA